MREPSEDRLYELLPGHHRVRDAEEGHPLQALMRLLAAELEIVEEDIDLLYDNWFIETCEPWAIPYIGALVGARPLRPFGESGGGLRPHVANTLAYRQAKGAAAALEQMARDATGWPSIAVEFFERMVWSQNLNHIRLHATGSASIRDAEGTRMTGTAFETVHHSAAAGTVTAPSGRYNIPNFGIFAWRLQAYAVGFLTEEDDDYLGGPVPQVSVLGPGFRRFDPLGADRPLFNRPRSDVDLATCTTARNVPGRLDRRILHLDLESLRNGERGSGDWFRGPPALQIRLNTETVPPDKLFSCNLEDRDDGMGGTIWRRPGNQGEVFFDPDLGRLSLHPDDETARVETAHAYGGPFDVGAGPHDRRASFETWRERLFPPGEDEDLPWRIGVTARGKDHTGIEERGIVVGTLAEAIERWNAIAVAGARGIITVLDSATYADDLTTDERVIKVPTSAHLVIAAAGWPVREIVGNAKFREPEQLSPVARRPHVRSNLCVWGDHAGSGTLGRLILDGLLIEGEVLVEEGQLGTLELRHTTLGAAAESLTGGVRVPASNELMRLVADHAVLGRIEMGIAGGGVELCDSILGEDRTADTAPTDAPLRLEARECDLKIARATIFGAIEGRTLEAENTIFQGVLDISRRQEGCVRFSFVPDGSSTPQRYRCAPDLSISEAKAQSGELTPEARRAVLARVAPQFASAAFNTDSFGNLALTCPSEIAEGAEGGAAMGVGFRHGEPFRRANLRDALEEYLPFGLEAGLIFAT